MVISLSNITPTHGSRYYAAESGTEAEQSQWAGKLVPVLEITQPDVEPATFDSLLAGKNPQGQVLVNKMRLAHESVAGSARAGVDLIAATPKSVSIQSLVFRDQRLVEAHQQVTRLMLQILEDRYAMTRIRTEGERRKVTTGNLLIAQFTHDSSRALDAHLHTHNVILNLTQRSDRRWASLDNEAIYRSRFLLDKIYQNELARLVQALGYAIHITNTRQGLWELQGFTPQQLQQFSKRSQQIQAVVGTDADYREREWAARYSQRPPKQKTAIEELQQQWQQQAEQLQIAALVPSSASMLRVHTNLHQIIDQAIAYCARRAPQFSREAVETAALSRTMGQYSFSMLTHAIDQSARLTIVNNNKTTLYYQLGDADAVQISARNPSNICTIPAAQTQTTAHWNRAESSTPRSTIVSPQIPPPQIQSATGSNPSARTPVVPAILHQIQALQRQLSQHQSHLQPLPLSLSAIYRKLDESTSEVSGSMSLVKLHLKELNQTTAQIPVMQAELAEIKTLLKKSHPRSKPTQNNGSWNADWKQLGIIGLSAFILCMATASATLYLSQRLAATHAATSTSGKGGS